MTSMPKPILPFVVTVLLLAGASLGLSGCGGCHSRSTTTTRKRPPLKWVTLHNCRLVPEEHRDGDSFYVRTNRQGQCIFRLYFVDAPETDISIEDRVRKQAEYFGVSQEDLLKAGEEAKKFTADQLLKRPFTVTTRWQNALGRGRQIDVGGRDLGELLVSNGWARAKGTVAKLPDGRPGKEETAKLQRLEAEAKAKRVGVWAKSNKAGK